MMKQVLVGSIVCVITLIFLNVFGNENALKITDELLTKENQMTDEASVEIGIGGTDTAYGVYIDIQGNEKSIVDALMTNAKKTVEVAVRYNCTIKEFEMADSLDRLGFNDETNP